MLAQLGRHADAARRLQAARAARPADARAAGALGALLGSGGDWEGGLVQLQAAIGMLQVRGAHDPARRAAPPTAHRTPAPCPHCALGSPPPRAPA
eukprot:1136592-Prymnesium_polylepis.1